MKNNSLAYKLLAPILYRRYRILLYVICIFSIQFSCNQNSSEKTIALNNYLRKISNSPIHPTKRVYFFFQLQGCSSCIHKMLEFFKENLNNDSYCFVVSEVGSKAINSLLSTDEINHQNVLIDSKAIASQDKIMIGQGTVYVVENGDVIADYTINPESIDEILKMISYTD